MTRPPGLRAADTAAGDLGRDDPHEQLPVSRRPGLDTRLEGRVAFGRGDVMGGPLDQDAPAFLLSQVYIVDLERHLVFGTIDPGPQVLIQRSVRRGAEHDRAAVQRVVHRQHGGAGLAVVGDAADPSPGYQLQARVLVEFFDHAVGHRGAPPGVGPGGLTTTLVAADAPRNRTFRRHVQDLRPMAAAQSWQQAGTGKTVTKRRRLCERLCTTGQGRRHGRKSRTQRSPTRATPSSVSTRPRSAARTCTSWRATCPKYGRAGSSATRPSGPSSRSATASTGSRRATGFLSLASAHAGPAGSAARDATDSAWRAAAGSSVTGSTAPRPSTCGCRTPTLRPTGSPTARATSSSSCWPTSCPLATRSACWPAASGRATWWP